MAFGLDPDAERWSALDLRLVEDVVASRVLDATRTASRVLTSLGIRHAVAGAFAVGAHGHPRATKVVDFLVGEEAFEHHAGGLVTLKNGVPVEVDGVLVDLLSTKGEGELSVVSAGALVYLKLKSPRFKDRADVVELVKAGLDVPAARDYLTKHASALTAKLEECVAAARAEE